jgi:putative ATPase
MFVDEVHRFNKSQQDAFLPHVESGLFTFIGATTENPSFEVNSALLSRAAVYVLQPLAEEDLAHIVERAQVIQAIPAIEPEALTRLLAYADGDARRLLNTLETLAMAAKQESIDPVTDAWLMRVLGERMRRYDKGGEQFYSPSALCINRCAARTPTPPCIGLCACSMGVLIPVIWRVA